MASLDDLGVALVNADAAGDVDAARTLAAEIVRLRGQTAAPQVEQSGYDAMGNPTNAGGAAPVQASMPYGEQMSRVGRTIDNAVRLAANGATFGLADKFAGGMNALTGAAPSYDEGVKTERAKTEKLRQENPGASILAEGAGGLLSGVGLMRSGVTLAGRMGPGLLGKTIGYGLEGGAYGAAQGAGNTYSDNLPDYVKNAVAGGAFGSMVGAGLPLAGAGAGAAYRTGAAFLGPRVEGLGRGASALMRGAAMADEQGLRGLGALGPDAMMVDAGPAFLGLGQGAATGQGAGSSRLVNTLAERDTGTARRLGASLDQNLGPAPIPSRVDAGIVESQRALSPEYQAVVGNAQPITQRELEPLARRLEGIAASERGGAQRAARQVREMLNDPRPIHPGDLDQNPASLLNTRQAIDGMLTTETDPNTIRVLTQARQAVDEQLTRHVPGIKDVDAKFAELARQREALTRGGQVLDSGKQAIRPVELADEVAQGALPQGNQVGPSAAPSRLREGLRADIDRRVGTNINDLNTLEKTFATPQDWNYQKIGTVFGEGPRDAVAADITANRRFRDSYQKIVQGSQTAQRSANAAAMEGTQGGNVPINMTLTGLAGKGVNAIAKLLSGHVSAATKDEIGRVLANQGPEANRIAQALLASARKTNTRADTIKALISSPEWIAAASPLARQR